MEIVIRVENLIKANQFSGKKNNRYLSALKVDLVNPAGDLVGGLQVSLDVHPVVLQRGLAHLVEGHHIDINHDGEGDDGNGEEKGW